MKPLIFSFLLILIACQNNSENKITNQNQNFSANKIDTNLNKKDDTLHKIVENKSKFNFVSDKTVDSIENKIYNLDKIQALNRLNKISILTVPPNDLGDSYDFKVGYNRPDRFETRYNFSFKKGGSVIYFYDVVNDTLIDINNWKDE